MDMSIKLKTLIWGQAVIILVLAISLLFLGGDVKQSRKMLFDQSNYCIRYTSEITANSRLDLIREQDAHGRDIDKANTMIANIIERYNALVGRYNKNTGGQDYDPLNQYSYKIMRTAP
jgi:hypothetical protein